MREKGREREYMLLGERERDRERCLAPLRKREMVNSFVRKREINARLLCQRGRDGRLCERESK